MDKGDCLKILWGIFNHSLYQSPRGFSWGFKKNPLRDILKIPFENPLNNPLGDFLNLPKCEESDNVVSDTFCYYLRPK